MKKLLAAIFALVFSQSVHAQEVNLSCQTVSAQTSVSFTTGWNSTFFDVYIFRLYNVSQSTGVNAQMVATVSTDGGGTYASTNYVVEALSQYTTEGVASLSTSGTRANWFASVDAADTAGYGSNGTITLFNLGGGSNVAWYQAEIEKYESGGGNVIGMRAGGYWKGSPGTLINGLKMEMTSGTMTGKFCMSGIRKQ